MQLQSNKITGNAYQGGNQAILLAEKEKRNYKSDEWLTFLQAKDLGKKLVNAKGRGVHLRTFTKENRKNEKTGKLSGFSRPVHFVVFNCDLLKEKKGLDKA